MSNLQAKPSTNVECSKKLDEEIKFGISSTIRGNNAADNAVQFNAPIAGTIIYCQTLNVSVLSSGGHLPASNKGLEYVLPICGTRLKQDGKTQEVRTELKNAQGYMSCPPAAQYVRLFSNSSNKFRDTYALYRPNVKGNWISLRIITSLKLVSRSHRSVREAVFDGEIVKSTGRYVQFACSPKKSDSSSSYRFYIVEHSPFDVLLGSDFTS